MEKKVIKPTTAMIIKVLKRSARAFRKINRDSGEWVQVSEDLINDLENTAKALKEN